MQEPLKAGLSQYLLICTNADTHKRTHQRDWRDFHHSTRRTRSGHITSPRHFRWWLSEFSVNMHASWLTATEFFPLVPCHTVLQSACSYGRLIKATTSSKIPIDESPQVNKHTHLIYGQQDLVRTVVLHVVHTLACFRTSRVEMIGQETSTKSWNGVTNFDFRGHFIWDLIQNNTAIWFVLTAQDITLKNTFFPPCHFTCNGTDHCVHFNRGESDHVIQSRRIQFIFM